MDSVKVLTPSFRWSQTDQAVRVWIPLAGRPGSLSEVQMLPGSFRMAEDVPERSARYALEFRYRGEIDETKSCFHCRGGRLELDLRKRAPGFWPHLLSEPDKARLKSFCAFDFATYEDEDGTVDGEGDDAQPVPDFGDEDEDEILDGDDEDAADASSAGVAETVAASGSSTSSALLPSEMKE